MIPRRSATGYTPVHCPVCPGMPVLPVPGEVDHRRCIRCQGKERLLPEPHPEDHLCDVCRRECPTCNAPSPSGGLCRRCRGLCRTCEQALPARPDADVVRKESRSRKPDKRAPQWERVYFNRSWQSDQCDACQNAAKSPDAVRAVLAALPGKVMRACGGSAPATVVDTIRAELRHHTPAQLADRVERRWFGGWASRPLHKEADEHQDGYRPDHVAVWLLAPSGCPARCDDGWVPGDPDRPCPACRTTRARPPRPVEADEGAPAAVPADRTIAEAVTYRPMRECEGRGGTCGVPVADSYTLCPSCADWPRCACGRRYDPERAATCSACAAI
ncbi:hypothetical protein [Streptomyces radiopugnans]|uniref:Uncharacterized protein n=1 Tax=Streptomyces radiopugnans TaxID=403935 RepID=A0A1H9KAK3_9ACTN|nr:hypothetical protein [Streptomyces radiopugnans]SEQ96174.1 hypothetical protein SAMN05216481_12218 [Streptomyces radiopugnans]